MKSIWVYVALMSSILILLPGCQRIVEWGKGNFYQGDAADWYVPENIKPYLKSVTVYDQFNTVGMFDVLWLSDDVRAAYTEAYTFKRGKDEEHRNLFLRRQLAENNHFIVFYILSPQTIPLSGPETDWSIALRIDDDFYTPIEIKRIELSPEYKALFSGRFNRFKIAYQVRFDAKDVEGDSLLSMKTKWMMLYFRSVYKEVELCWELS